MPSENLDVRYIPLAHIEKDPDQPRKALSDDKDNPMIDRRLYTSIKDIGIQQPLVVSEVEPNRFILLDGHRRYDCAKAAGLETVPCSVYQKLEPAKFELIRYEIQNNRKPWAPTERANALNKIKIAAGITSDVDLAKRLHVSVSLINYTLKIRDQKLEYVSLMERYELKDSYQVEFLKLKPKIRKIKELEVETIIHKLLEKIRFDVITNAQQLRTLKKIFLRKHANEEHLYRFFTDDDMTIGQLDNITEKSAIAVWMEDGFKKIEERRNENRLPSEEERQAAMKLTEELQKFIY